MNTKKWDTARKMKCLSFQPTGSNVSTVKYHRTYSCVDRRWSFDPVAKTYPSKASITIYVISFDGRTNGVEKEKSIFYRPSASWICFSVAFVLNLKF